MRIYLFTNRTNVAGGFGRLFRTGAIMVVKVVALCKQLLTAATDQVTGTAENPLEVLHRGVLGLWDAVVLREVVRESLHLVEQAQTEETDVPLVDVAHVQKQVPVLEVGVAGGAEVDFAVEVGCRQAVRGWARAHGQGAVRTRPVSTQEIRRGLQSEVLCIFGNLVASFWQIQSTLL